MSRVLAPALRIAAAFVAGLLAQAALWSPGASLPLSAGLAGFAILSWWRPAWGLIGLAALAPLGRLIFGWGFQAYPIRAAEALLFCWLAGVALRAVHERAPGALPSRLSGPWVLLAATVLASAAVLHHGSHVLFDSPGVHVWHLVEFLTFDFQGLPRDPRPWMSPSNFAYAVSSAVVIGGTALVLLTARLCRADAALGPRLVATSVAAAAVAGLLSLDAFARDAVSVPLADLPGLLYEGRWAVHVNKVNTAGSYFVLLLPPAVVLAWRSTRHRIVWAAAALLILAALLLTASLAAFAGAVIVPALLLGAIAVRNTEPHGWRRAAVAALAALVVIAGVRPATRTRAMRSLDLRLAITQVSLDTAAEAPIFGVGIGTYPIRSVPHVTPYVREGFGEGGMQPHNYLLQVAAELGLVGLGLLLWALAGLARTAGASRTELAPGRRWDRPVALGLAAFYISALSGQPMLVDGVAVPVYLLMGLVLGHAGPREPGDRGRWVWLAVMAILLTVPWRAAMEIDAVDPRWAGYGTTYEEIGEGNGSGHVHVLEGPARLFVHRRATFIRLEAQAIPTEGSDGGFIRVWGSGVPARTLPVHPDRLTTTCFEVEPEWVGTFGLRPLEVRALLDNGQPAPPRSVWVTVRGLMEPCQ